MSEANEKKILVPRIQNMDDYFIKHYKKFVIQELNKRIASRELSAIVGKKVKTEQLLPGDCFFKRFNYWRLNRTDMYIDIEMRLILTIETPDGDDSDLYDFYVELWFCFDDEDEEECEFNEIGLWRFMPQHDECLKLDEYLIPIMRQDEIDLYTEEMWQQYDRIAANDAYQRAPDRLASRLGLKIMELPLCRKPDIRSILFFQKQMISVYKTIESGEHYIPEPENILIPADTIVINRAVDDFYNSDIDVYHEIFHYEFHYLFYRLQNMYSSDLDLIKISGKAKLDSAEDNPLVFIEKQTGYGSYALMMPIKFMKKAMRDMYKEVRNVKRADGYHAHKGWYCEMIGRRIADEYNIRKSHVRTRMIHLGHQAAYGALNYADGHYVEPFAFTDLENAVKTLSYVIDRQNVSKLYMKDEAFQRVMQSGDFVYVDGHIVVNDSGSVTCDSNGARLTPWANAHIDSACLRFEKSYEKKERKYKYEFGRLNNEADLRRTYKFVDPHGSLSIREAENAKQKLIEDMPDSFHGALVYLMKGRCTVDELVNRIPISRSTLMRLRKEDRKSYKIDQLIAICVGLHIPPWLSSILFQKAGLGVPREGSNSYYGMILDCFYMDSIEEVQQMLINNGFPPLKLDFEVLEE